MSIKKDLIKLGTSNPELRPHIREVLNHTEGRVAGFGDVDPDDVQSALLNLRELLHNVGLKKYSAVVLKAVGDLLLKNPTKGEVAIPVKVPEGFDSLFSSINIYVRVRSSEYAPVHMTLDWTYKHPSGGGNGLGLGVAANDGWRTNSGKTGGKTWV